MYVEGVKEIQPLKICTIKRPTVFHVLPMKMAKIATGPVMGNPDCQRDWIEKCLED
jgi:hypothetical protein